MRNLISMMMVCFLMVAGVASAETCKKTGDCQACHKKTEAPIAKSAENQPKKIGSARYTVKAGDTMSKLARRFHVKNVKAFMAQVKNPNQLTPGQKLELIFEAETKLEVTAKVLPERNDDGYRKFWVNSQPVGNTPEDQVFASYPTIIRNKAKEAWKPEGRRNGKVTQGDRFEYMTFKSKETGKIIAASKQELAKGTFDAQFGLTFEEGGVLYEVGRIDKCRNLFIRLVGPPPVAELPPAVPPVVEEKPKPAPKKPEPKPAPKKPEPKPVPPPVEPPPAPVEPPKKTTQKVNAFSFEAITWGSDYNAFSGTSNTGTYGASLIARRDVGRVGGYAAKLGLMATFQGAMGTDKDFPWHNQAWLVGPTYKLDADRHSVTFNLQVGKQSIWGSNGVYSFDQADWVLKPEIQYENSDRRGDGKKLFPKHEASVVAIVGISNTSGSAAFKGVATPYSPTNASYADVGGKLGLVDVPLSKTVYLTPYVGTDGYKDFGQNQYGVQGHVGTWITWNGKQVAGVEVGLDHRIEHGTSAQTIGGYLHLSDLYYAATAKKDKK